jgi:eukaryotic-like serine/threonine-protein kinase
MIGKSISHYVILEKIGAGGMGEVYRAHDEQLDRDVALKVLPPGLLADEPARKRFRHEALALARLNHPNIETVFEFSSADGIDFLAIELIQGEPLSETLTEGPLPEKEILRLAIQATEGLAATHDQGIIHRDLKPANLMITFDGRVKILDFGLAKLVRPGFETDLTKSIASATGTISGTVPYMSPEQLRGMPVDIRSDIYAAGAVLYQMAAGRRPFPQSQNAELIGAILHKSPEPVSSVNPQISPALERVIFTALEKEPAQRYQSARDLRAALESISTSSAAAARALETPAAQPAADGPSFWGRDKIFVASAALALVLLASLFLAIRYRAVRNGLAHSSTSAENSPAASSPSSASPNHSRPSVAVLGFKNISGQPDKAWLSTALSEMLTTELAAGEQLRTVPGENIAQMKVNLSLADADSYGQATLQKIHANLNADDIVLGSYVPIGNGGLRLDLRLQDADRGETIDAISATGSERQIDDLVDRVGAELRQKLGAGAVTDEQQATVKAAMPSNADAAKLYADGLAKLRLFEAAQSVDLFQTAIAADPKFALAHSALASAWSLLGHDNDAQSESKKAFDLSNNLPREQRLWVEGHYREYTYDWPKAIDAYKSLVDVFPDNLQYGLQLARAQTAAGRANEALKTIADLRRLPAPSRDDPLIGIAESKAAIAVGDFKRGQAAAELAATQAQAIGARLLVARALLEKGDALFDLGKTKDDLQAAEDARQLFAAAGDMGGVASALTNRGNALYRLGDLDAAKHTWEESLSIAHDIGDQTRIGTSLNNLGLVKWHTGDLRGAKTNFDQALAIANQHGDRRTSAQSTTNLAGLLYDQGDLSGAARMEEKTLDAFREIGDRSGIANANANLGMMQSDLSDYDGALARFAEASAIFHDLGETSGVGSTANKRGNVFYLQGKAPQAKAAYDEGLAAYTSIGDKAGILQSQGNLASALYDLGDLAGSRKMYEQAIAAARELGSKGPLAQSLRGHGDVLLAQADFDGAKRDYDEALNVRQALKDEGGILDSRLGLATLAIEQGHSADAEPQARQIAAEYHKNKADLNEAGALAVLAYALLQDNKLREAAAPADRAALLAGKSKEIETRTPILITAARVNGFTGKSPANSRAVQAILDQATTQANVVFQLQARLALAEIESHTHQPEAAAHLAVLEKDATAKGFTLIARQAAARH